MTAKIWKIRGKKEQYTDEELVSLIKKGLLKGDDYIATKDMKVWIRIKDSIYQFYLKEDENEII